MTASKVLRPLCLLLGLLAVPIPAVAQVDIGADFVNRYVWRGYDFGESFSIQPSLAYSEGGFSIGTWASYSISSDGSGANEHDLYVSYARGPVEVGLTDYYFPVPRGAGGGVPAGGRFFNFEDEGEGAHLLEPYVALSGPAAFPLQFYAAVLAYNDPDHSVYLEAAYAVAVQGVDLGVTAGFVPMESGFYLTDGPSFVNLGVSASRAVAISDTFSLPITVQYVLNPETERTFLVFGLSLGV